MGVFHHDLKYTAQSCLHKNRGSALNLDNAAAFLILLIKAQDVGDQIFKPLENNSEQTLS